MPAKRKKKKKNSFCCEQLSARKICLPGDVLVSFVHVCTKAAGEARGVSALFYTVYWSIHWTIHILLTEVSGKARKWLGPKTGTSFSAIAAAFLTFLSACCQWYDSFILTSIVCLSNEIMLIMKGGIFPPCAVKWRPAVVLGLHCARGFLRGEESN